MTPLNAIVNQHRAGQPVGITSVCSAHPVVLAAAMAHGRDTGSPVLIESTCNQVNHRGGYTGQTPSDFTAYVTRLAEASGLPHGQLILGGDHLGPSPWQALPAEEAMAEARALVAAYVAAGYTKIHLDASMRLGDDPPGPLPISLVAQRSAELAAVAEANLPPGANPPLYVVGSEVPIPGGMQGASHELAVTRAGDAAETLAATRHAFTRRGLDDAWSRVIALVVQPGVEFGDDTIIDYDRAAAADLSNFITGQPGLVYEAHSTDYQTPAALRQLVEDHFAILKVGPGLTFAYREAVFALEMIECEWLRGRPGVELSGVRATLDAAMLANPAYWQKYYGGNEDDRAFKRAYSLSDRARYYWPAPPVQATVARLMGNLSGPLPLALLSQYLPRQHDQVRAGALPNDAPALLADAVEVVLRAYGAACRPSTASSPHTR
jgi:D-tagatose-1,6-bisphosphate aldolase subunit GatZ/KbaZ